MMMNKHLINIELFKNS